MSREIATIVAHSGRIFKSAQAGPSQTDTWFPIQVCSTAAV